MNGGLGAESVQLVAKEKKPSKPNVRKLSLVAEDPALAGPDRPLCQLCGLFQAKDKYGKAPRRPFMPAHVPEGWTRRLLGVGEGPGGDEDLNSGRPFTGESGQLLRKWLAEHDFGAQDVALTNSVRCRPPDNATPNMTQIRCCRPFLLWELEHLKPATVLALGNTATRALTNDGEAAVTKLRGRPLTIPKEEERT